MLGMVANPASVMIDIYSDRICGETAPARADGSAVASANLVANSALGTVSEFSMATVADGELEVSVETANLASSGLVWQSGLVPASPTR